MSAIDETIKRRVAYLLEYFESSDGTLEGIEDSDAREECRKTIVRETVELRERERGRDSEQEHMAVVQGTRQRIADRQQKLADALSPANVFARYNKRGR